MTNLTLCYALVYVAEAFIGWQYLSEIFEKKMKSIVLCVLYGLGYGAAFFLFDDGLVWLNILIFTLLQMVLIRCGYTTNWVGCLFHSFLLTALMFVSEIATAFPLGLLFNSFGDYQTNSVSLLLLTVISKILYFILTKVCIHLAKGNKHNGVEGFVPLLLSSVSVTSIVVLVALGYIGLTCTYSENISFLMMSISLLLLFSDILIFVVYQRFRNLTRENLLLQLLKQREESDRHYFEALEAHYNAQKILIHDIRKHLRVIREMAKNNNDRDTVEYVSGLESVPQLQQKIRYSGNSVVNVILSYYAELCEKRNIEYIVDIRDRSVDWLAPNEITALLGNLCENAVEAAAHCITPHIELVIERKEAQKATYISLVNTCLEPPIKNRFGEYTSQKQDREQHGIGLKSVRKIIEKYNGQINQYYDSETKTFHSIVLLNNL